jgi:hypothetical protein
MYSLSTRYSVLVAVSTTGVEVIPMLGERSAQPMLLACTGDPNCRLHKMAPVTGSRP